MKLPSGVGSIRLPLRRRLYISTGLAACGLEPCCLASQVHAVLETASRARMGVAMRNLITKQTGLKRNTKAIALVCKQLAGVVTHGVRVSVTRFLSDRMAVRFAPAYAPAMAAAHQAAALHERLGLALGRQSWRPAGPGSARSGGER